MGRTILKHTTALLCLATCGILGCGGDSTPRASEALFTESSRQTELLLLTVGVEIDAHVDAMGPLADAAGLRLNPGQITEVSIEIDGEIWGRFAVEDSAENPAVLGPWALADGRGEAMLAARLTANLDQPETPPSTVGDWLDILKPPLKPGAHLARLSTVTLTASDGTQQVLSGETWYPFTIAPGAESAWIGAVVLTTNTLQGL